MSSSQEDSLLTDLCTICHLQPPKYRCPRCNTRTCSLPCTRRHKLWSQCSGVRDPAAYLRRSELATATAFDRDFNFITGIERSIERAGRDAENRGIRVDGDAAGFVGDLAVVGLDHSPSSTGIGEGVEKEGDGQGGEVGGGGSGGGGSGGGGGGAGGKRKRGGAGAAATAAAGPARRESGFLREVRNAGVKVIRAPRGMSRNKENGSRWFAKQQCLVWTVEWIGETGEKRTRNCRDSVPIALSYDRAFPLSREEREKEKEQTQKQTQNQEQGEDQGQAQQHELPSSIAENVAQQPEDIPSAITTTTESSTTAASTAPTARTDEPHPPTTTSSKQEETHAIFPHRNVYFYLHRPRTATKQPVLIPLAPSMTLTAALRGHTVLEFPTIYVLPDSPAALRAQGSDARYLLEDEYIRTHAPVDEDSASPTESEVDQPAPAGIDLGNVDEKKVLEVLKKDLFEPTMLM